MSSNHLKIKVKYEVLTKPKFFRVYWNMTMLSKKFVKITPSGNVIKATTTQNRILDISPGWANVYSIFLILCYWCKKFLWNNSVLKIPVCMFTRTWSCYTHFNIYLHLYIDNSVALLDWYCLLLGIEENCKFVW